MSDFIFYSVHPCGWQGWNGPIAEEQRLDFTEITFGWNYVITAEICWFSALARSFSRRGLNFADLSNMRLLHSHCTVRGLSLMSDLWDVVYEKQSSDFENNSCQSFSRQLVLVCHACLFHFLWQLLSHKSFCSDNILIHTGMYIPV